MTNDEIPNDERSTKTQWKMPQLWAFGFYSLFVIRHWAVFNVYGVILPLAAWLLPPALP